MESNDLDDTLWATRCVKGHDGDLRLFAVWCARQVQHLNTDVRVETCLDVVTQYATGDATTEELTAAWDAAWDAAEADAEAEAGAAGARAAWDAARAAAKAEQTAMFLRMLKGEAPWQENRV